ncbi:MAG: hypothetical protein L0Z62_14665 [Gemmataceae bacterium]|nr:hypothetical protein [Gemmataceae bacterium]
MAEDREPSPAAGLNLNPLTPTSPARLLTRVSGQPVTVEMLQAAIAAGAPTNPNETINRLGLVGPLVHLNDREADSLARNRAWQADGRR